MENSSLAWYVMPSSGCSHKQSSILGGIIYNIVHYINLLKPSGNFTYRQV
jgi:hypothetical protein